MTWYVRLALGLTLFAAGISSAIGQEPPAKSKVKVELRWLESNPIEGLTENEGFQSSCDPKSIVYPHKKPALVLTAAEVAEARLTHLDLSRNGLSSENYFVTLHLTKEARDKLAAACTDEHSRTLTVLVDGKYWGMHRYEKGKDTRFVPAQACAESFTPSVGCFSSKAQAQRLVDAYR